MRSPAYVMWAPSTTCWHYDQQNRTVPPQMATIPERIVNTGGDDEMNIWGPGHRLSADIYTMKTCM